MRNMNDRQGEQSSLVGNELPITREESGAETPRIVGALDGDIVNIIDDIQSGTASEEPH